MGLDMDRTKTKFAHLGVEEHKNMDFMPPAENPTHIEISQMIVGDKKYISDHSGYTNNEKWSLILNTFNAAPDSTLFAELSYDEIYTDDDPAHAEAAAYLADLRTQYFNKLLEEKFTPEHHMLYLVNRQWMVRFRERALLSNLTQQMKSAVLH
jgi:hypothetical protein